MARRRLIIISRTWVPSAFQSRWSLHVRGARSRPCGKFTWNRLRLPWREAGRTSPCPGLRSIPCASCLRKARWQGTSWIIFWYPVVGIRGGRTLTGFWKISGWSITPQTTLHLVFHKRDHLTSNNAALHNPWLASASHRVPRWFFPSKSCHTSGRTYNRTYETSPLPRSQDAHENRRCSLSNIHLLFPDNRCRHINWGCPCHVARAPTTHKSSVPVRTSARHGQGKRSARRTSHMPPCRQRLPHMRILQSVRPSKWPDTGNAALSFPFAFLIHQGMACHIQRLSPCFWHNSRKFPKCARHPPMWRLEL